MAIDSLLPADSPRLGGQNPQHVELLARLEYRLPPILVNRATMRVIDGMHRVEAARLRGDRHIEARFYEGHGEDEFVVAVRLNTRHGLALSQRDRSAAALRIMRSHPTWSDRRIASVAGISPATVGAIRRRSTDQSGQLNSPRVGRDGRVRPVDAADGRERARRFLVEHPEASLREIAAAAGIAPATAKDVRERVRQGRDPLLASQRRRRAPAEAAVTADVAPAVARERRAAGGQEPPPDAPRTQPVSTAVARHLTSANVTLHPILHIRGAQALILRLQRDPALRLNEQGRLLLRLLSAHADDQQWRRLATTVPAHARESVAQVARQCAAVWLDLASSLEAQKAEGPRAEVGPST
ncbi:MULTISPECIES: hypothetical protein [Streptomyces]|uniref:hypothetical protein n=1 Tax=Streptomyces TaxID=1883 RepID=UPI001D058C94|nr:MULTISPECIES: hypothetical protein [Streptomyces]